MNQIFRSQSAGFNRFPEPQKRVLRALADYGFLHSEHVRRRYYYKYKTENTARKEVQEALTPLERGGFITARRLTPEKGIGSGKNVYWLTTEGRRSLRDLPYPLPFSITPPTKQVLNHEFWTHPLAITDVLINADLATEVYPEYLQVTERMRDQQLKKRTKNIRPTLDSYIVFAVADNHHVWHECPVIIEVDNGTEYNKGRFQEEKIAACIHWYETHCIQQLGRLVTTIAFLSLVGEGRKRDMYQWTEDVLHRMNRLELLSLFRFSSCPLTDIHNMFFEHVWSVPFDIHPVSLFQKIRA